MSKLKKHAIAIGIALTIAVTVLLVLLPASVNLYIGYSCCLLGIVMLVLGAVFFDRHDMPGSFAQLLQAAWFLPVSLLVSAAVLFLQPVVRVSPLVHGCMQFILCVIAAIRLISVQAGKSYIRTRDAQIAESTACIADWLNIVDAMQGTPGLSADARAALRTLRESIRYADPMSNASAACMDESISEKLSLLQADSTASEVLIADCEAITQALKHRNNVLKSTKA